MADGARHPLSYLVDASDVEEVCRVHQGRMAQCGEPGAPDHLQEAKMSRAGCTELHSCDTARRRQTDCTYGNLP